MSSATASSAGMPGRAAAGGDRAADDRVLLRHGRRRDEDRAALASRTRSRRGPPTCSSTGANGSRVAILVAATVAIDLIYFGRRTLPAKFLHPGTLFLLAFQIVPIIYTIDVAFTNYSTGHILIEGRGDHADPAHVAAAAAERRSSTHGARARLGRTISCLILQDQVSGADFVGTEKGLTPLPQSDVKATALGITAAKGYTIIKGAELFALDQTLRAFHVPTHGQSAITPQTISTAAELEPTLRYDSKTRHIHAHQRRRVFRDNGTRLVRPRKGRSSSPAGRRRSASTTSARSSRATRSAGRSSGSSSGRSSSRLPTVFLSFCVGLLLAIA